MQNNNKEEEDTPFIQDEIEEEPKSQKIQKENNTNIDVNKNTFLTGTNLIEQKKNTNDKSTETINNQEKIEENKNQNIIQDLKMVN